MKVDEETQSVVDYALVEHEFLTIVSAVQQNALRTRSIGDSVTNNLTCDSLTLLNGDPADFMPNPVFTSDVSIMSCELNIPDSKSRTGKIQVRVTDKVKKPGAQMIIKLINYEVSGITYHCDSMMVATKEIHDTYSTYQFILVNGLCKAPAYTVKYDFDRILYNYSKGEPVGTGSLIRIYGNSSGVNRHGVTFSTAILSSGLTKYRSCAYVSKGTLEITLEGFKKRTIDFGSGMCDEEASFTVNENTVTFKLK